MRKLSAISRWPNRRSQSEGCTLATLRTFLQLTISRTSMRFPSKPYERPSFFRRKGNRGKFSGEGRFEKLHVFTVEFAGPRNFQRFAIAAIAAEDRRGTIPRRLLVLLDESAPWSHRTHARRRSRHCAGFTRALLLYPAGRNAHDAGCPAHSP